MNKQFPPLFPSPQRMYEISRDFTLPDKPLIYLASTPRRILFTAQRLQQALVEQGLRPELTATAVSQDGRPDVHITLQINPKLLEQPDSIASRWESYRLVIDKTGVTVTGADAAGLFYGVCTLKQLIRQSAQQAPLTLPGLHITDWPDYPQRGVMLDVSRDKVPTLETLCALVDRLADWKINQVQLYTEHTFAYRGHEVVWQNASPLSGEDILALDTFCRQRRIELVPNQNSFGHMHRWLIHEPYRRLAECPDGFEHPFNPRREPYSLCPQDPGSLALLADLYDQLLPHFSSRQFNVGLDETFDLGHGRSQQACQEKGTEQVYLEFLKKVYRLVSQRGHTVQFWGDIILNQPDLIGELPQDSVALAWGYEAEHPFAEQGRRFAEAGLNFYVCPGTSSWNSIAGRTDNALGNLRNAAINGQAAGATGLLNTDWGDNGHLQPLPISDLGFLAGAGFSWNVSDASKDLDLPALLDVYAFQDQAGVMGRLAYDLGNAYLQPGALVPNSSILFWLLVSPEQTLPHPWAPGLSVQGLEKTLAYIDRVMEPLPRAKMTRPDAELVVDEFRWAADVLRLACRLGIARLQAEPDAPLNALPPESRAALAEELRPLIERHREIWSQRNRPGGLDDSTARLERTLALLAE